MGLFKRKKHEDKQTEMKTYMEHAGGCIITKSLAEGSSTLKWVFREEPVNDVDNGWRAFGDCDDDAYVNDSNNLMIVDFNTLANIEPSVLLIYELPIKSELQFVNDQRGTYFIDCANGKEIHEKIKSSIQIAFEKNLYFLAMEHNQVEELQQLFKSHTNGVCHTLGNIDISSGSLIVADPLCYMQNKEQIDVLERTITQGDYPVLLSIFDGLAGIRIAGAKLVLSNQDAERYEVAKNANHVQSGFGVEAGMCCFADQKSVDAYHVFLTGWYKAHPKGNIYDDYFKERFLQSALKFPKLQREEGDFILWQIPDTTHTIAMFASGLGDGFYTPYWGMDADNKPCELLVPFINIAYFV